MKYAICSKIFIDNITSTSVCLILYKNILKNIKKSYLTHRGGSPSSLGKYNLLLEVSVIRV